MKKVCLILPKGLPLPNVKGGAIETLVTALINQNEIHKKVELTVVSIYDKEAIKESKKYKHTSFIYIKQNTLSYCIKAVKSRIYNCFNKNINTYNEMTLNKIKYQNFDYVIFESGAYLESGNYLKYFDKHQMVLHLHHTGYANNISNEVFGKIIGVSNYVIKEYCASSNISNKYLLKNSIDVNQFKKRLTLKEKEELRSKLNIKKNDFVVLYCGRLIKEKGVLELINAINNWFNKFWRWWSR